MVVEPEVLQRPDRLIIPHPEPRAYNHQATPSAAIEAEPSGPEDRICATRRLVDRHGERRGEAPPPLMSNSMAWSVEVDARSHCVPRGEVQRLPSIRHRHDARADAPRTPDRSQQRGSRAATPRAAHRERHEPPPTITPHARSAYQNPSRGPRR
jgi:hypothetical protein